MLLLILWLSIAKTLLSLAAALVIDLRVFRTVYFLAHVLLFGIAGILLLVLGRRDRRAIALGTCFVLTGTAWSDALLYQFGAAQPAISPIARILAHTQVAAFTPLFFWSFVRDFPHRLRFHPRAAVVNAAVFLSFAVGFFLFLANLLPLWFGPETNSSVLQVVDRATSRSLFWPLIFLLTFPAIAYTLHQARYAPLDEVRRVRLVLASLIIGFAPEIIVVLGAAVSPSFHRVTNPRNYPIMYLVVGGPMMAVPFLIAYAVLVHKALDLQFIVRKTIQYGLARYSIVAFALLPFAIVLLVAYQRREQALVAILNGPSGLVVVSAITAGFILLASRPSLLAALDRRFFREQYDAHQILASLVQRGRILRDLREIAAVVPSEIDRALHLQSAALYIVDKSTGELVSPTSSGESLPVSARLVRHLQDAGGVLELDFESRAVWLTQLPRTEQEWITDHDPRLLVQIAGRSNNCAGVLVLGEKRSELPFSREDKQLLRAVADAVGLSLENLASQPTGLHDRELAYTDVQECTACGLIAPDGTRNCTSCGDALTAAMVPRLLAGKYRAIQRIGRGGMGVVYRALDESLDRPVAIKTLPSPAANLMARMRREARAMAAVAHPNLEAIFAVESKHGVPLLVVELMTGGTLADRLRNGPLSAGEALEFSRRVAAGLECMHNAGILHRDVKPSNIAFTADGTPKLLDFGVVHMLNVSRPADGGNEVDGEVMLRSLPLTASGEFVGTVPYLSPEAIALDPPTPDFDLWALSMVAYESIAGALPIASGTPLQVMYRITAGIPDIRQLLPGAQEPIARFFLECLNPDIRVRPRSAREWSRRAVATLENLRTFQPA